MFGCAFGVRKVNKLISSKVFGFERICDSFLGRLISLLAFGKVNKLIRCLDAQKYDGKDLL